MLKDITFGQYYPVSSIIHKLDARVKIIATICYIVAVFLVREFHFLGFAVCATFLIIVTLLARVKIWSVIRSIKAILFFVFLSAILQILFGEGGNVLFTIGSLQVTDQALMRAGFIICRITLIVMGASLLTLTTSPVEIADGIESLLYPLKFIKFPVHEFALIMSIALRFIPTLLEETDRIICAQKARGANFESGNIFKRAKALIPVLIPLLIGSFRRADELADAMDARCYSGSKNRTKYKKQSIKLNDVIAFLFIVDLIVTVLVFNLV